MRLVTANYSKHEFLPLCNIWAALERVDAAKSGAIMVSLREFITHPEINGMARQTIRLVISLLALLTAHHQRWNYYPVWRGRKSGDRAFIRWRRFRMTEFAIKNYYFYRQVDVTTHVALVSCKSVCRGGQAGWECFRGMNYKVEPAERIFLR